MAEWQEQGEDTSSIDGSGDDYGYQQDAQEIAQHLGPQLADMVQEQIAQRDEAYALIAEYPQVAETPEATEQFMDRVKAYADEIGADPDNPKLQRAVAKVEFGQQQAGQQQPGSADDGLGDDDFAAALRAAGRGRSVLPF